MWGIRNLDKYWKKILYKTKFLEDFSTDENIILKLNFKTCGGNYEVDCSGWSTLQ